MDVTRQSLLEHFQLLSDEALLSEFESGDLTELAKELAASELERRKIDVPEAASEPPTMSEAAPISGDLALVARYFTAAEGHMLQSRLELAGIPAIVADDHMAQTIWSMPVGGVRVLVPESYLQQAHEIVAAIDRGDYAII